LKENIFNKISKSSPRIYNLMAHGEFREKLLYKAQDHDTKIIVGNESYTTKTCGNCRIINEKVGGNKVFHCTHCGLRAHRYVHAARNIVFCKLFSKKFTETSLCPSVNG
jgi:putative transposase